MRRWLNALIVSLLASTSVFASVTLHVTVKDESDNNIDGATVYALVFTNNGPDPVNSLVGVTVDGAVDLALTEGIHYEIFPTKDGFTPTLRQQFSSPDPALHHHIQADGAPSPLALTLHSNGAVKGTVTANVTHATPNTTLFGQVFRGSTRDDMAMGACRTDGSGACSMVFVNVPAGAANSYRVGAHDPTLNKGNETKVTHELAYNGNVGPYDLDLSGGLPPETADRQNGNQPAGDPSVQGVVQSTTGVPIPYLGVNYQSTNGPGFWTQTDQNGRFSLYGLTSGTTYYAQIFSGCNQQGCYEGYSSPKAATRGAEVGPKDIVFNSASAPMKVTVQLSRAEAGDGEIPIYVKNQDGDALPGANINIWPDGRNWHMNPGEACEDMGAEKRSNPGLANVSVDAPTGYGLVTGLPPGNYTINVWSPFSSSNAQYNAGEDGTFNWDWNTDCASGTHIDDLRVTISTVAPYMNIYDSRGNDLGLSSVTVVVNTVQENADKTVALNLTFPETVDLSADPILVSLKYCGENGCSGAYHLFNGSGSSFQFPLAISTGSYWVEVYSKYWGVVREGGGSGQVVVTEAASAPIPLNLKFGKAGRIKGYLYKPDGTLYIPEQGEYAGINAQGIGVESHGWANISKDGSFMIGGLMPGSYRLLVNGGGNFDLASPMEPVIATVVADQDTYAEYRTVNGTFARPEIDLDVWTPPFDYVRDGQDEQAPLQAYFVPAGTKMTVAKLNQIMDEYDGPTSIPYAGDGDSMACRSGGDWEAGFCLGTAESPKAYDFYLFRKSDYRPGGTSYMQLTPLHSVKNVVIDADHATESLYVNMSTRTYVPIDLTPTDASHMGTAVARGDVTADNLLRESDFQALGGDFNNFVSFIPIVTLYRTNGEVQALGLVTPRPEEFGPEDEIALTRSLAGNDWETFKAVFDSFNFSYRIEGLAANTDYIAVFTTPNYPPYKTTIHTGAGDSLTVKNVDFDDAVGAGATLTGVVSAGGTPVPNASVTVKSPGIEDKTLTTGADGRYTLEALPKGAYRITTVAAGYVPNVKAVTIDDANVTQNVALVAGTGTIRGTVYKRRFPSPQVLIGATIVAYNDTQNGENPTDPLYLYTVKTSSVGVYELSGLEVGDTYRLSLAVPGKYVLSQTTAAASSPVEGIDFTLQTKALDVEVSVRKRTDDFEIMINNPSDFASGEVRVSADPFDLATSTDITSSFTELPNKQLVAHLPFAGLSAAADYLLHIEAESYNGETLTKDIPFSLAENGVAEKQVDLALLGDETENSQGRAANEVLIDESGTDPSGVEFPTGGLITSTGTADVPTMSFAKTDREEADDVTDDLPAGGALSSDIYTLGLENAALSERGFNLTLGFDPDADWTELAAYVFNPTTQEWERVPGVQTIDPTAGTIQLNVTDLTATAQGAPRRARAPLAPSAGGGMRASFNGQSHRIRANATSGSGQFAVLAVPAATITGTTYTGDAFKIFNFPNPFNVQAKTIPVTHGGGTTSLNTTGTVIKYEIPSSVGTGQVVIRIYSLSGELVRELHEGDRTGGHYYYTPWDGKNKDGKEVANGVYYGVLSMPGVNVKDARFKLAVVK